MSSDTETLSRAMSLAVHELRTPMTVVAGYLRMLLRDQAGPLSNHQRKMLEEAERSCGRIGTIVSEMSELGKLEAGELGVSSSEFDLTRVIAELAANMHEGDDRGIRLEVRGTDRPLIVRGDRTRLGAAVTALVRAALRERATPGVLVVECSTVTLADVPYAVVAIGDEAVLELLIRHVGAEPPAFDEWRGGLGLALPVGRRVIEAHGGAIWSAPGDAPRAGSALRLPLTDA